MPPDPILIPFAANEGTVDVSTFAQYGVLGIITLILIWFAKGAHQRERDRADQLQADNKALNQLIIDRVIPALTSSAAAIEQSTELIRDIQRERENERRNGYPKGSA